MPSLSGIENNVFNRPQASKIIPSPLVNQSRELRHAIKMRPVEADRQEKRREISEIARNKNIQGKGSDPKKKKREKNAKIKSTKMLRNASLRRNAKEKSYHQVALRHQKKGVHNVVPRSDLNR